MVFRVFDTEWQKEYSLKIVIGKGNVGLLKREYARNNEISADCVVRGCDLIRCEALRGAGMLMEEVGTKVVPETVLSKFCPVFDVLVRLYSTRHVHGDARVANLLNCEGIYNFEHSQESTSAMT